MIAPFILITGSMLVAPVSTGEAPARAALPITAGLVENLGQWAEPIRYIASAGKVAAVLDGQGFSSHLLSEEPVGAPSVRFEFAPKPALLTSENPLPGLHHFFLGLDPSHWVRGAHAYAAARYHGVQPGIDLVVHAGPTIEYDLVLAPGADLEGFEVRCEGASSLSVRADGSLLVDLGGAELVQSPPHAWTESPAGRRREIACVFEIRSLNSFGFRAPEHDAERLIVDPGLAWSTYFGGSTTSPGASNTGLIDIEVDAAGATHLFGRTGTIDLPLSPPTYDETFNGGTADLYVAKFAPDGRSLEFATYIGGSSFESGFDLALGPAGELLIVGSVPGLDKYVVTPGALKMGSGGAFSNPFATAFAPDGSELIFSAIFGGHAFDHAEAVDWHAEHGIRVGIATSSTAFPGTASGYDSTFNGELDLAVVHLATDGSRIEAATYYGGSGFESIQSITVLDDGDTVLGGYSESADFPTTPGAFKPDFDPDKPEACITRFDPTLTSVRFSTFVGTSGNTDMILQVLPHPSGHILLGGEGTGAYPTTPDAFQTTTLGGQGMLASILSGDGTSLLHSTMLSTGANEQFGGIVVDDGGYVSVLGSTSGKAFFITPGAYDDTADGAATLLLCRLNPSLSELHYATFLGGTQQAGVVAALAQHRNGDLTLAASYNGADFPTTADAFQPEYPGLPCPVLVRMDVLPTGVERTGTPSGACDRSVNVQVTKMPKVGTLDFGLVCVGGKPHGLGLLAVAPKQLSAPLQVAGMDLWLDPTAMFLLPVTADELGSATASFALRHDATPPGTVAHAQWLWFDDCAPGALAASPLLTVTVQP